VKLRPALFVLVVVLLVPPSAAASPNARFGIQDDAWLLDGPGSLSSRLGLLDRLGVQVVRVTLRWDQIEQTEGTYDWSGYDTLLDGLQAQGIPVILTIWGTPRWASGGGAPTWAPQTAGSIAAFARAAARHYSWIHRWEIWNEPNLRIFLNPNSPKVYVQRLLNPAYTALHAVSSANVVAGGVTSPRATATGLDPVAFMRGMRAAHAKLDVYSHHPYPLSRRETPFDGCPCVGLTMASLPKLLAEVRRDFGGKHVWLTEYGYQTDPPDTLLGVSFAKQALYIGQAARRVAFAPGVDVLIHFLIQDEPQVGRWQSGLLTVSGAAKPSENAFAAPLAQVSRSGSRTVFWGQIRPRAAGGLYQLQRLAGGRWRALTQVARAPATGFTRTVTALRGARVRVWCPRVHVAGPAIVVS
jgi:hypothetical protein